MLENPSTYLTFASSTLPEEEFIARMAEESDCALLLDVNNVYVTCRNHDLDPYAFLRSIPYERVVQIHLAGHIDRGTHLLDTHSRAVCDEVWDLYRSATRRIGAVSSLIEWDEDIPEWEVLEAESERARALRSEVIAAAGGAP